MESIPHSLGAAARQWTPSAHHPQRDSHPRPYGWSSTRHFPGYGTLHILAPSSPRTRRVSPANFAEASAELILSLRDIGILFYAFGYSGVWRTLWTSVANLDFLSVAFYTEGNQAGLWYLGAVLRECSVDCYLLMVSR